MRRLNSPAGPQVREALISWVMLTPPTEISCLHLSSDAVSFTKAEELVKAIAVKGDQPSDLGQSGGPLPRGGGRPFCPCTWSKISRFMPGRSLRPPSTL